MTPMVEQDRLVAIDAGEGTVLLLFQKGAPSSVMLSGRHDACTRRQQPGHFAFAIDAGDLPAWEARLACAEHSDRKPRDLGARRPQPLLPQSGSASRGAGDPRAYGRPTTSSLLAAVVSAGATSWPATRRRAWPESAVRDGAARLRRSPSETLVLSVACGRGLAVARMAIASNGAPTAIGFRARRDLHDRHTRVRGHRLSRCSSRCPGRCR